MSSCSQLIPFTLCPTLAWANWTECFLSLVVIMWSIMIIRLGSKMGVVAVLVTWMTQFKIEAEFSHSVTNIEVKLSLARTSGPNFNNLMKTVEKEGFF